MPIDYSKYPDNWKTEIRPAILKRAKNRCEWCGVKNYSVGHWKVHESTNVKAFRFIPTGGNAIYDAAGNAELTYKEASDLVKHSNEWCEDRLIVIVLTIAHLDHDVKNNDYENLRALCQRCHNSYDVPYRKRNREKNRGLQSMFAE